MNVCMGYGTAWKEKRSQVTDKTQIQEQKCCLSQIIIDKESRKTKVRDDYCRY